jgi:hypothetical protein
MKGNSFMRTKITVSLFLMVLMSVMVVVFFTFQKRCLADIENGDYESFGVETSSGIYVSGQSPYAKWKNGPSHDESFFPIGVWLQQEKNAEKYKAAGINVYVALWDGPTESQLAELKKAGMKVICSQNEVGLKHVDDETIVGWILSDVELDNAQPLGKDKGYGPPVLPEKVIAEYNKIRNADPTRPVLTGFGQGVAWNGWNGRGVRTNHPEDYPEYVKGSDIATCNIYPVADDGRPQVYGKLWYVARGVTRLVNWTERKKPVWNAIECTRIQNREGLKATPQQVRCEVWMSIIHGSMGITYFVHEWKPKFNDAALLDDPEMLSEVTSINQQIKKLAPVLNSPAIAGKVHVVSANKDVPVAAMMKERDGAIYLFSVAMREGLSTATFTIDGLKDEKIVQVLGEDRIIESKDGVFKDNFKSWDVHIYRIEYAKTN